MSDTPREAAEVAVLGAVMLSEAALGIIADERLRPEHFWTQWCRDVFAAMLELSDSGHHIDQVTLKAKFAGSDSMVSAGLIEVLAGHVPNVSNLRDYCRIVREGAWFDEAASVLFDASQALSFQDRPALLAALRRLDESEDAEQGQDDASEFMAWYDSEQRGWPLPFQKLTDSTGGMLPGEVTILGAWSGFGKTVWLSQMLREVTKAGARCHEYANEMYGPKRTARLLSTLTGIPTTRIDRKGLSSAEAGRVMRALGALPYQTDNSAGWTVEEYCRRMRRDRWDVAAIDTVTNLSCSRVDEWDRACTMLADTAAQTGTHLILVCQLNLERDKGKRPPPVGRDLRNTGLWYHRARVVMFLHRDQEAREGGDGSVIWQPAAEGHVRIDKASHGDSSIGYVSVQFNARWMRFDQAEGDEPRRHLEAV